MVERAVEGFLDSSKSDAFLGSCRNNFISMDSVMISMASVNLIPSSLLSALIESKESIKDFTTGNGKSQSAVGNSANKKLDLSPEPVRSGQEEENSSVSESLDLSGSELRDSYDA